MSAGLFPCYASLAAAEDLMDRSLHDFGNILIRVCLRTGHSADLLWVIACSIGVELGTFQAGFCRRDLLLYLLHRLQLAGYVLLARDKWHGGVAGD
jgi:hypothetical protein